MLRCQVGSATESSRFQFAGHQPVGRIGGIVLSEGAIGCVARRFQIALECFAHLIARLAGLSLKAPLRFNTSVPCYGEGAISTVEMIFGDVRQK